MPPRTKTRTKRASRKASSKRRKTPSRRRKTPSNSRERAKPRLKTLRAKDRRAVHGAAGGRTSDFSQLSKKEQEQRMLNNKKTRNLLLGLGAGAVGAVVTGYMLYKGFTLYQVHKFKKVLQKRAQRSDTLIAFDPDICSQISGVCSLKSVVESHYIEDRNVIRYAQMLTAGFLFEVLRGLVPHWHIHLYNPPTEGVINTVKQLQTIKNLFNIQRTTAHTHAVVIVERLNNASPDNPPHVFAVIFDKKKNPEVFDSIRTYPRKRFEGTVGESDTCSRFNQEYDTCAILTVLFIYFKSLGCTSKNICHFFILNYQSHIVPFALELMAMIQRPDRLNVLKNNERLIDMQTQICYKQ